MSERYRVQLKKAHHVFSAAHFITYDGQTCEPLHGHNYRVAVELEGPLDENHYVVDFVMLDKAICSILADLDHHVLLPTEHPAIRVVPTEKEVVATFEQRRWVFPRSDCVLLPLPNTTAELLARYIAHRLIGLLAQNGVEHPRILRVAVDESLDQWGQCELEATPSRSETD